MDEDDRTKAHVGRYDEVIVQYFTDFAEHLWKRLLRPVSEHEQSIEDRRYMRKPK